MNCQKLQASGRTWFLSWSVQKINSKFETSTRTTYLNNCYHFRLINTGQKPNVNAEQVLWQMVRLFSTQDDTSLKHKLGKLAQVLLEFEPKIHTTLVIKKKELDRAIEGDYNQQHNLKLCSDSLLKQLQKWSFIFSHSSIFSTTGLGCHGLTPDVAGLTHLHVALKTELLRHIETYKNVLHRLDELGLASNDSKKPTAASHHRLLSLRLDEVQKRLIDNKTLLTLLDKPALQQLRPLIGLLSTRVQNDKEALFCVSQLKRFVFCSFTKLLSKIVSKYLLILKPSMIQMLIS